MKTKEGDMFCNFCGTHQEFCEFLVSTDSKVDASLHAHICAECLDFAEESLREKREAKNRGSK